MRRGKEIAQGSHASMEFLTSQIRQHLSENSHISIDLDAFIEQQIEEQTNAIIASFDSGAELFHVEPLIMVEQLLEATR